VSTQNNSAGGDWEERMSNGMKAVEFTHVVQGSGIANAVTVTGKMRMLDGAPAAVDVPLVVAVHGGTYTSDYLTFPDTHCWTVRQPLEFRSSRLTDQAMAAARPFRRRKRQS